jgi:parallel beta-helix repeat protein
MTHLFLALALLAQAPAVADDSPALNAAIRAVATAGGGTVQLEPRTYAIGDPLDGSVPNVMLRGVRGRTVLAKALTPSYWGILRIDQPYQGWTFEGVGFDGNACALIAGSVPRYYTAYLSGTRGVRFDRCSFRDLNGAVQIRDSADVAFADCDFFGTRPGIFQAGVMDPPAVPGAIFTSGVTVGEQCRDVRVSRSRFHYCDTGVSVGAQPTQSVDGLEVSDCRFRADWWDSPGALLRFAATKVELVSGTGYVLTVANGGLGAACTDSNVVSFRRDLAAGAAFTSVYTGNVRADGQPFARAVPGDAIETADGRRARIGAVEDGASVNVEGWESIDCYEPCPPPPIATPWRLVRYYACGTSGRALSDTTVALYFEPVCPYTGERAISEAKWNFSGWPGRVLAKSTYSGLHVNAGVAGLIVQGNTFRGSWADQCSVFGSAGARILGNRFLCGQDEAVTLTGCPRAVVSGNVFDNSGVSAVFVGGGANTTISGNTVSNWGVVNPGVGAIDGSALGLSITSNTVAVAKAPLSRVWSRYAANLYGSDCSGTVIAGNSGDATAGMLQIDKTAAPKKNAVTVRDVPASSITGDGKANVKAN